MIQRYYIAVPNIPKNVSYHHIPSWTNYSFTGTYDEAMITAIELFEEKNFFDDSNQIIQNLIDFYKNDSTDSDSDEDHKWYDWDYWGAGEKWENCKEYFIDYFNIENENGVDEYVSGVCPCDQVDYEFKKNWDEDILKVYELQ